MTIEKRKRGRPAKPAVVSEEHTWQTVKFEELPPGNLSNNAASVASWYRTYLTTKPHVRDRDGEFQKWMNAAATALEANDAVRVGYYAYQAMRFRGLLAYQEPVKVDGIGERKMAALADEGKKKLQGDKKRGRRVKW